MTIASEITRLQTDKEAMRQAIIEKGVDVAASVSFDDYAACILAIQTPPKISYIDLLIVGGGGGAATDANVSCKFYNAGGGGGGGVKELFSEAVQVGCSYLVSIGLGGASGTIDVDKRGGASSFGDITASGGGGTSCVQLYTCGGTDGGGSGQGQNHAPSRACRGLGKYCGGAGNTSNSTGGGGGAGGNGGDAYNGGGGNGGLGVGSCMSGELHYYGGGGGGGTYAWSWAGGTGCHGGGNGGVCPNNGTNATYYGGGGGGPGGNGCQGIVIVRYKTDGSCGISNATGGTVTTSGDYTVHTFTADGTFTIVS